MKLAAQIGILPTEFWSITPFELNTYVHGYGKIKEQEQKQNIYQAYLISRFVWQKKINIEKILQIKKEKKIMTDEQMLKQVQILSNIFHDIKN